MSEAEGPPVIGAMYERITALEKLASEASVEPGGDGSLPRVPLYRAPRLADATPAEFVAAYMKQDAGKPTQPELLDPEFLLGVSAVLKFGAEKYAPNRWREGMAWSRVYGALLRHLFAFWSGEETDEETGLPHLHHAGCCLMFLSAYSGRKRGERWSGSNYDEHDDRP